MPHFSKLKVDFYKVIKLEKFIEGLINRINRLIVRK